MIAAQMLPNYRREREATVQETLAFCAGFRDKRRATRKTARKIGPFVSSPAISHKRHGIFRPAAVLLARRWGSFVREVLADMYHEKNDDFEA
uniref:Bm8599 n=1 Tax=Brugia malayi TaxID=6279 RepID=A0A1I9G817_BRUMA|nr:Bm8599 [Brugia malayi]